MPITPGCHSSLNRHKPWDSFSVSDNSIRLISVNAWWCISPCISRRSLLSASSCLAISNASSSSLVIRQSIPRLMSVNLPAAFNLGPIANPRSLAVIFWWFRFATWNKARKAGIHRPALIRSMPFATRMRLLKSRGTTSATVPRATRSRKLAKLGSFMFFSVNQSRFRNSARKATNI